MSEQELALIGLLGAGAAATGLALLAGGAQPPSLWYKLEWPREIEPENVIAFLRNLASDRRRHVIGLETVVSEGRLTYRMGLAKDYAKTVLAQLQSYLPGVSAELIDDQVTTCPNNAWQLGKHRLTGRSRHQISTRFQERLSQRFQAPARRTPSSFSGCSDLASAPSTPLNRMHSRLPGRTSSKVWRARHPHLMPTAVSRCARRPQSPASVLSVESASPRMVSIRRKPSPIGYWPLYAPPKHRGYDSVCEATIPTSSPGRVRPDHGPSP